MCKNAFKYPRDTGMETFFVKTGENNTGVYYRELFRPPEAAVMAREQHSDGFNQNDKEDTLFLNVHPSIQFHYSCAPRHHLHCITSYTGCSGNVVLGFKWGQTVFQHQIEMWVDDGHGNLQHHSTVPVYGRYKIEHILFIPSRGVLVGYCSDCCLRVMADKTQEMAVLHRTECPASVACMHYCNETNELLTGSMGLIAFWGFFTSAHTSLSLLRVLDWTSCSLQRETVVSAFVSQSQTSSVYALCDRSIKSFKYTGEKKLSEFRGQSYSTLRCVVAEWQQRYLYTGDAEGYMQLWSFDTHHLLLQFRAHASAVTCMVLLPESGTILSASKGCWIKQWSRGGDLLLKLHTDMPGVQSMWKLGKNVILCQSSNSLDVWRLNSAYRSFNDTACGVRVLRRLDCGGGKARILAVTQEGIIRFFSPVTGELLFLSWPFLHIDEALGFAYDPVEEELYICDGSVEVLVLNTTLSPCPVKHIINTVDGNDGVLCLATVLAWSSQDGAGDDGPLCLVFSGHRNGKLQLLAPLSLLCKPKKAHSGAICQMSSSDAGKTPLVCCYGDDHQFTLWSVRLGACQVDLSLQRQISCRFIPVHFRVLQGLICAVSPQQNLILYSVDGGKPAVIERKRSERISCLDYCPQLDIMAVSGQSGKLEIWNREGHLVAEVQLGVPVTQVCFGNARGDILASFSDGISVMSVTHILPSSYLRTVLQQAPTDDIIEPPIPFLPKSLSHYDISLVPKIYLKYVKMESLAPETTPDPITVESIAEEDASPTQVEEQPIRMPTVRPFVLRKWRQPAVAKTQNNEQEPCDMNEVPREALIQAKPLQDNVLSLFSHIAPDGYIPNSVVRGIHTEEQEEEEEGEEEELGGDLPVGLLRDYEDMEDTSKHSEAIEEILKRTKMTRMQNALQQVMKVEITVPTEEPAEAQEAAETLEDAERERMQTVLTLLEYLNSLFEDDYKDASDKLILLLKELQIDKSLLDQIKQKYVSHVKDSSLVWRQFEGLNNLHKLSLLHRGDIGLVASVLTHAYPELRALARISLNVDFKICDKRALRNKLLGLMSPGAIKALLGKLTDDLQLIEDDNVETSDKTATLETKIEDAESKPPTPSISQTSAVHTEVQSRKFRKSYNLYGTAEDFMGKKEKHTEEEKTHTEMPTGAQENKRVLVRTPKRKTKRAARLGTHAKWDSIPEVGRSRGSAGNPLLYAFRKARKYGPTTLSPTDVAMPKYESRLVPIDSGFGSLASQEVSSKRVTTGGRGGLLPIGKPKKLASKAHDVSQHTSQFSRHSSQHSQPGHDTVRHHDIKLHDTYKIAHHYDTTTQHRRDSDRHHDITSQHPQGTAQHYDVNSQHSYDTPHHYDITSLPPSDTDHHYDITSQHPHSTAHHYEITSQHPHSTAQHYDINSQHSYDTAQHYDITSQHPHGTAHHYDVNSQHPHGTVHHYDINSQHSYDTTYNYDITSQHPHGTVHHYHINSQHSYDTTQDYEITSQHPFDTDHHYDITSQHPHSTAHHYDVNFQHFYGTTEHCDITSQHASDTDHYVITSKHPHGTAHHYDVNSQHPYGTAECHDITSRYPYDYALHSDVTSKCPPGRTEHPLHPSHHPRHVSQRPPQHDPHPRPHHASLAPAVAAEPCEQGKVREQQGDTHWRQSLHKLISLYGFRSRKAAKAAASLCPQPPQLRTRARRTALPPLRYGPPRQGAPGERVTERVELTEGGGRPTAAPLKFQHEIPLPWRLSHYPLRPQGQVRYGKLEMDWVRTEIGGLTLPKIVPKRSLVQK